MLKNDKERFAKQYHFTAWPDEGAPENGSGLLNYRQKVQGFNDGEDAPIIVHCRYATLRDVGLDRDCG